MTATLPGCLPIEVVLQNKKGAGVVEPLPARTAPAGLARARDRRDVPEPVAEPGEIGRVTPVVEMGDEGDMRVRPDEGSESLGDRPLEVHEREHVRAGGREHVVGPEDDLHRESAVPELALDELETGAVASGVASVTASTGM